MPSSPPSAARRRTEFNLIRTDGNRRDSLGDDGGHALHVPSSPDALHDIGISAWKQGKIGSKTTLETELALNEAPIFEISSELGDRSSAASVTSSPDKRRLRDVQPSSSLPDLDALQYLPIPSRPTVSDPQEDDDLPVSFRGSQAAEQVPVPEDFTTPGRQLRIRKAIQLHPYLLEQEEYKRTMKARGANVIRIASDPANETDGSQYETQERFVRRRRTSASMDKASWDNESLLSSTTALDGFLERDLHETFLANDSSNTLPGLDYLHQRRGPSEARLGLKRRKMAHAEQRTATSAANLVNLVNPGSTPLSPPGSASSNDAEIQTTFEKPQFRRPRHYSPNLVPTPAISSDTCRLPQQEEAVEAHDSHFDSESDRTTGPLSARRRHNVLALSSQSSTSSSSESDSERSDPDGIERVQKRIKGVLPASWLKLDLQAQGKRTDNRRFKQQPSPPPPSRQSPQRGLAHKIRSSTRLPRVSGGGSQSVPVNILADFDVFSNNSTGETEVADNSAAARAATPDARHAVSYQDSMDIEEHDYVDPMLASSRPRTYGRQHGKQQSRLRFPVVSRPEGLQLETGKSRKQRKSLSYRRDGVFHIRRRVDGSTPSRAGPVNQALPPPSLSIIDQTSPSQPLKVPDFIKIASRQVRKRRDLGRHKPSRKEIRLATHNDTEDAQNTLHNWRSGVLKPALVPPSRASIMRVALADHEPEDQRKQQRLSPVLGPASLGLARQKIPAVTGPEPRTRQTQLKPSIAPCSTASAISDDPPLHTTPYQRKPPKRQSHYPGQLESLATHFKTQHRKMAFQTKLQDIDRAFGKRIWPSPIWNNPQLTRFLYDEDAAHVDPSVGYTSSPDKSSKRSEALVPRARGLHQLPRKQVPKRLDVGLKQYRQPSEEIDYDANGRRASSSEDLGRQRSPLTGLGPFGTRYSKDFGIRPLQPGTYFHQSTFIGSGLFRKALETGSQDLNTRTGHALIMLGEIAFNWDVWTSEVASEMETVFGQLAGDFERSSIAPSVPSEAPGATTADLRAILQSVIKYFAEKLSFLDPVDCSSCVMVSIRLIEALYDAIQTSIDTRVTDPKPVISLLLTLTYQLVRLADNASVEAVTRTSLENLTVRMASKLMQSLVQQELVTLAAFLEDNNRHSIREAGVRDHETAVETLVILVHILRRRALREPSFWELVQRQFITCGGQRMNQVSEFERIWQTIFTFCPFLEYDEVGLLKEGQRFETPCDGWSVVKTLLNQLFPFFSDGLRMPATTANEYFRTSLARCHVLIKTWGWHRCETLLNTIYDFFAKIGLAQLRNEEAHGGPRFLERLDQSPSLHIEPEDQSFQIFLKIVAEGLLSMRNHYLERKMQSITWRLIPNHGRSHRKEDALSQKDLDALRNHHDLLSTLYWGAPPKARPRLDVIRNLVDHSTSHRQACALSIRTWTNLVRFQLSTSEPYDSLLPFVEWHNYILRQTVVQHRLARTEAETDYEAVERRGNTAISAEMLQSTVSRNQRLIEGTLCDACVALKVAFKSARDESRAAFLLRHSLVADVLKLFNPDVPRLTKVVVKVLEVFEEYHRLFGRSDTASNHRVSNPANNDDSQDYGDWSALEELDGSVQGVPPEPNNPFEGLQEPMWQLMSSSFGSESSMDESFLLKIVDIWVMVAEQQVLRGAKEWHSFIDVYSSISWHQLRDTQQKRRFTPYFISLVLEKRRFHGDVDLSAVVSAWLISLVERESMLRYQHRLTSSLLNAEPSHALLQDLPFARSQRTGQYEISSVELRERRLSLISSILCNMQGIVEDTMRYSPENLASTKHSYAELLKPMMNAMKHNFLELQRGSEIRGAYVTFVQKCVEYLQQYATDVCPIDSFFTNSASFPLPAKDPTYIVGRLRAYEAKLADQKPAKQLVMFIQNVSERAAVDAQQDYLVDQIVAAASSTRERGNSAKPTLRAVLMEAIIPAYVKYVFTSSAGWIVAKPLLEACTHIVRELLCSISPNDSASREQGVDMLSVVLACLRESCRGVARNPDLFGEAWSLRAIALTFRLVQVAAPNIDYLHRLAGNCWEAMASLRFFTSLGQAVLHSTADVTIPTRVSVDSEVWTPKPGHFPDVYTFCVKGLQQWLSRDWTKHGDEYYVTRGNMTKEVLVNLGTVEEEKLRVRTAIETFLETWRSMPCLGGGEGGRRGVSDTTIDELVL